MNARPESSAIVPLRCSGCGVIFAGAAGLAGALCGRGRVELAPRCPRHDAALFVVSELGGPFLACRHCLESTCGLCEEPVSLCSCEPCEEGV